jgi:hypothetical protein
VIVISWQEWRAMIAGWTVGGVCSWMVATFGNYNFGAFVICILLAVFVTLVLSPRKSS